MGIIGKKKYFKRLIGKIKKIAGKNKLAVFLRNLNKKYYFYTVMIIVVVSGLFFSFYLINKKFYLNVGAEEKIYSVAVIVSADGSDPKTNHQPGDVIVVQEENYQWSDIDKKAYLILKMRLTGDQANKLVIPKEKEIEENTLSEEVRKQRQEGRDREENVAPAKEYISLREYRIKMNKFKKVTLEKLQKEQPYPDKIFNWSIVEARPY